MAAAMLTLDFCGDLLDQGLILKGATPLLMYRPIPHSQIIDDLMHLRDLYREGRPANEREQLAHDAREAFTKDLIGNLSRMKEHLMPGIIAEAARHFRLTVDGAHRLFGYNLSDIQAYDLRLNGSRTRLIESYAFDQDLLIDLPLRFGEDEMFHRTAFLRDLVPEWQTNIPIRGLYERGWQRPGMLYVRIGIADSLGWNLPPGSIASVEPIGEEERQHPGLDRTYLLQFGNGYRCSRCRVSRGRLSLAISASGYTGPYDFPCPGEVRIIGRVHMFALELPLPEYPSPQTLPFSRRSAPLMMPWEYRSLPEFLAAKSRRFQRPREEFEQVIRVLNAAFGKEISGKTLRRYLTKTDSIPHVNFLIELALSHMGRYSDALRVMEWFPSERNRFSLETFRGVNHLYELSGRSLHTVLPVPEYRRKALLQQYGEWPALLSMKFPHLRNLEGKVIRLQHSDAFNGLDPLLPSGALFLLEEVKGLPDTQDDATKTGWRRPIYALRKENEIYCGYLETDSEHYVLVPYTHGEGQSLSFTHHAISQVDRVIGAAIPVDDSV